MMNRIDAKFRDLKRMGRKAFIAYITLGDPSLAATGRLVLALEGAGVDIVELGIPFSDPLADGPTIQAASQRALAHGVSLADGIALVKDLRKRTRMPIVFMTYFNPVFKYGVERTVREGVSAGVDGIIIPDLPCEEAGDLVRYSKARDFSTVFLAAPTSSRERMRRIVEDSTGFIYYVSITGVTGARRRLPAEISSKVRLIRSMTTKPVAVGFGISHGAQAKAIAKIADGVIVGSALVRIIGECGKGRALVPKIERFAKTLAEAIHHA